MRTCASVLTFSLCSTVILSLAAGAPKARRATSRPARPAASAPTSQPSRQMLADTLQGEQEGIPLSFSLLSWSETCVRNEQGTPIRWDPGWARYRSDRFVPTRSDDPTVLKDEGFQGLRGEYRDPENNEAVVWVHIEPGRCPSFNPGDVPNPRMPVWSEIFQTLAQANPGVVLRYEEDDGSNSFHYFRVKPDNTRTLVDAENPMFCYPYKINCDPAKEKGYVAEFRVRWSSPISVTADLAAPPARLEGMVYSRAVTAQKEEP